MKKENIEQEEWKLASMLQETNLNHRFPTLQEQLTKVLTLREREAKEEIFDDIKQKLCKDSRIDFRYERIIKLRDLKDIEKRHLNTLNTEKLKEEI